MHFGDPQNWVLDLSAPIMPQLTHILRERIIRGDMIPGHRMSESEMAKHYHISRQPVREAFIRLADQGLLEIRPQRGTFVSPIHYAQVLDARFLREAIEADIVRILAAHPDPGVIAELEDQLARQQAALTDPDAFIALDDRFHRTLAEAAGKANAWGLLEGLKSQMDRVRYLAMAQFPTSTLIDQHRAITAAIAAGDPIAAEAAIRQHLREILHNLPLVAQAHMSFFQFPPDGLPTPRNAPLPGVYAKGTGP